MHIADNVTAWRNMRWVAAVSWVSQKDPKKGIHVKEEERSEVGEPQRVGYQVKECEFGPISQGNCIINFQLNDIK